MKLELVSKEWRGFSTMVATVKDEAGAVYACTYIPAYLSLEVLRPDCRKVRKDSALHRAVAALLRKP